MFKVFHFTKKISYYLTCSENKAFLKKSFGKLSEKESILEPPCCEILDL